MNIVFLMAGLGKRMGNHSTRPKPLIEMNGKTMIAWATETLGLLGSYIFITLKNDDAQINLDLKNELLKIKPEARVIELEKLTAGPAQSALAAKALINNEEPLLITNCDQVLLWDALKFQQFLSSTDKDGIVVTYDSKSEKNSYIKLDQAGNGIEVREKLVISPNSLNGVHWWRKGSDFIRSAEAMIEKNIRVNNEFYIAPTYNELILENKKIGIYPIKNEQHWPVGTEDDLKLFLEVKNGNS